ncbi:MAG: GNAT family N-acetyltransferase [Phycisphaerales bacterium]|nr:GNAT family N-acetyltransferase [Phycisphaerales bacterium]
MKTSQRPSQPTPDPQPQLVPPGDRIEAITRLLPPGAQRSDADRFQAFAAENSIPLDWLWSLPTPSGRHRTCVLAVPSPGRTAMLFSSKLDKGERIDPLARVLRHCLDFLTSQKIELAQSLLQPTDTIGYTAFESAGFQDLAVLQYMEVPVPRRARPPALPDGLELVPYDESMRAELAVVLDASYEDTLDCPGLRGLRQTDDVITGHQATGHYDPSLWTLARHDGAPVGVVLINRSTQGRQAELVYIGVASTARGRGWGRLLIEHGLFLASQAKMPYVSLAVDMGNQPAVQLYNSLGFVATSQRRAVIRSTRCLQESHVEGGCPPAHPGQVDNACG